MKPIKFSECNGIFAENQPQYLPLPAHNDGNVVTVCWSFSIWERIKLLFSGVLWLQLMSFEKPLTPHKMSIDKPEI